jgi:hypothetical protein
MPKRCVSCWATAGLLACTKEGCPHLLCPDHNNHGGRCRGCWESGNVLLSPWPLGAPRSKRKPLAELEPPPL